MNTKSKQSSRNAVAATIKTLAAGALLMLAASFSITALAQEAKQDHSGHVMGRDMKMPHTAQEHRERAEQYQKKAVEYRKDAEAHRKMLGDYSKTVARNPKDAGRERLHQKDAHSL